MKKIIKDFRRENRFISIKELIKITHEFSAQIKKNRYQPNQIIYIERAGRLIGKEMSNYFNCPLFAIHTINEDEKKRDKHFKLLRYFPKKLIHGLKILERNIFFHKTKKNIIFEFSGAVPDVNKKTLLVDDAIDTGRTFKTALAFLSKNGFAGEKLKTAVITSTMSDVDLIADYSYYNDVICSFPWSVDSKEKEKYEELYKKLGNEL